MSRAGGQQLIEDFPAVTLSQLRRAVNKNTDSGCRFSEADFILVALPNGVAVRVDLLRRESNLGMPMTHLVCPECRHACRTLRLVPTSKGLACRRDLRRTFRAKYRSQTAARRTSS